DAPVGPRRGEGATGQCQCEHRHAATEWEGRAVALRHGLEIEWQVVRVFYVVLRERTGAGRRVALGGGVAGARGSSRLVVGRERQGKREGALLDRRGRRDTGDVATETTNDLGQSRSALGVGVESGGHDGTEVVGEAYQVVLATSDAVHDRHRRTAPEGWVSGA